MYTEQMTQGLWVADQIVPSNASNSANAYTSGGIDMSKVKRAIYYIQVGAITGAGTVDAKLQTSANANFNVVHNLNGSNGAITQLTNASPNTIVSLEVRSDQVEYLNPGDRYLRLAVTIGANSVIYGALGLGGEAIQKPASQYTNTTTVPQQVVVNA